MANRWILRKQPNAQATLRLLCFPYAGGGASVFRKWADELPGCVEVLAVELPGRESRFAEPLADRAGPLVSMLADASESELNEPFAIFGHSMGAMFGFAFAHELRKRGRREPVHLFVSGHRAPQLPARFPLHGLGRVQLLDRLRQLGGMPEALLHSQELLEVFVPILQADIALAASVTAPAVPLGCPITALGGREDPLASPDEIDAWRTQTTSAFDHELFAGGHFYVQTERAALLGSLSRRLDQIAAAL